MYQGILSRLLRRGQGGGQGVRGSLLSLVALEAVSGKAGGKGMMYGKHFSSMYEGSMFGAGSHVFAVMGYIISHQVADRVVGSQVRLNPKLLMHVLGDTEKRMQQAIDYLCAPDPKSNTPTKEGRRLIKIGQFDYQVVNGALYMSIRNEEERRAQNREAKRRERAKPKSQPLAGESVLMKAIKNGDDAGATRLVEIDEARRALEEKERAQRTGGTPNTGPDTEQTPFDK